MAPTPTLLSILGSQIGESFNYFLKRRPGMLLGRPNVSFKAAASGAA